MSDRLQGDYDPVDLIITLLPAFQVIAGVTVPVGDPLLAVPRVLSGFSEDTKAVFARANPVSAFVVGTDNEQLVNKSRKQNGTMAFTLMKGSLDVAALTRALTITQIPNGRQVFFPLQVFLVGTNTLYGSPAAVIQNYAEASYGAAEGDFVYTFDCGQLNMTPTGRGPGA